MITIKSSSFISVPYYLYSLLDHLTLHFIYCYNVSKFACGIRQNHIRLLIITVYNSI